MLVEDGDGELRLPTEVGAPDVSGVDRKVGDLADRIEERLTARVLREVGELGRDDAGVALRAAAPTLPDPDVAARNASRYYPGR